MTRRKFTRQYLRLSETDITTMQDRLSSGQLFSDISALDKAVGLTNSQVGILVRAGLGQIISLGESGCVLVVEY